MEKAWPDAELQRQLDAAVTSPHAELQPQLDRKGTQ
jgi:hypothetical protein